MDLGLERKVALVAASSEGIGKAIALGMAREGARVAMCARRAEVLERAADEVRAESGVEVLAVTCNVSKEAEVHALVDQTVAHFGRLDVLVNNAGGPPAGDFTRHENKAWYSAFETNLMSAVWLIRAALPHLKASGRGRIINLTSSSVRQPVEGLLLSNSIRSGVIGMAKTLSSELAPFGITVNNIAPGRIDTARIRSLDRLRAEAQGLTEAEARASMVEQIPLGRYGEPDEVAHLAVFLASDKAAYITGTTIQVDGGMIKGLP